MWTIVAIVWIVVAVVGSLVYAWRLGQLEVEKTPPPVVYMAIWLWPSVACVWVLCQPFWWAYKAGKARKQREDDAKKGIIHGKAAENLRPGEVVSMTAKGEFERYKGGDPEGQVTEAERPDA